MENNDRPGRPNEAPPYSGQASRYGGAGQVAGVGQEQGRTFSGSISDRFRPSSLSVSGAMGRGGGNSSHYGYYNEAPATFSTQVSTTPVQYQADYPIEPQRQQGFTSFNTNMMYNVAPEAAPNATYDSNQHFPPRQPASLPILAADVAAPYFAGEPANAAGTPGLQHHPSPGSSAAYQQNSGGRAPPSQQYLASTNTMGTMPQNLPPETTEETDYPSEGSDWAAAYAAYQTALKDVFGNIKNQMLAEASRSLVDISDWLLSTVGQLGMF